MLHKELQECVLVQVVRSFWDRECGKLARTENNMVQPVFSGASSIQNQYMGHKLLLCDIKVFVLTKFLSIDHCNYFTDVTNWTIR